MSGGRCPIAARASGTLHYETRGQRFTIDVNPGTGCDLESPCPPDPDLLQGRQHVGRVRTGSGGTSRPGLEPRRHRHSPTDRPPLVSDEYGPSLLDINRAGPVVHRYEIPANLLPRNASPGMVNCAGDTGNTAGMRTNRGFETLAISPDCRTVYAMLDEGAGDGSVNRIVAFNTPTARPLAARTGWKWKAVSQGRGISALVAIDNHEFLVLERNNRGLGVAGELSPRTKRSSASTSLAPWTCRTCTWPPCQPIRTLP